MLQTNLCLWNVGFIKSTDRPIEQNKITPTTVIINLHYKTGIASKYFLEIKHTDGRTCFCPYRLTQTFRTDVHSSLWLSFTFRNSTAVLNTSHTHSVTTCKCFWNGVLRYFQCLLICSLYEYDDAVNRHNVEWEDD